MEHVRYKRSNSCTDIIYDVMSDDEDVGSNSIDVVTERSTDSLSEAMDDDIIYDDVSQDPPYPIFQKDSLNLENSRTVPPALLPKIRPALPRVLSLTDLDKNKLPVVIEVIEGICDEDDKKSIYTEDKLVVLSRGNTCFVTCINTKEQMFNIPIIPNYQIALMSSDTKLNSKLKETVKSILEMKDTPNQIIANTDFEIEGVCVVEGQILEVSAKLERNAKYLRVQTLSGEDIELPKSLKNTFSCSISSDNTPLPLAIESCVFPQQVVLTDTTCKGRTRKMLCTILDSFTDTFFKVCAYTGDIQSSFKAENAIFQMPIDFGITFKIIERVTKGVPQFHIPDLDQRQLRTVSRVIAPVKVPPPTCKKPQRSMSFSNLTSKVRNSKEIEKPRNPGSPRLQKSCENERNCLTPPLVKNKPAKATKGKFDKKSMIYELRNISLERVANFEDTGPSKVTKETKSNKTPKGKVNQDLAEENKNLKERISSLETSLSQRERDTVELQHKLDLLETALAEANTTLAMEIKRNKQIEMRERSLPAIPNQVQRSTPPVSPTAQFPEKSRSRSQPKPKPVLTAKPKLGSKHKINTEQEHEGTDEDKHTMHYLGTVLDKINLSQYKETFFEQGINTEIFVELDEEVLENELGVKAVLHRKKLLKLALRIKNNEDISHFFVDAQYTKVQNKKEHL